MVDLCSSFLLSKQVMVTPHSSPSPSGQAMVTLHFSLSLSGQAMVARAAASPVSLLLVSPPGVAWTMMLKILLTPPFPG